MAEKTKRILAEVGREQQLDVVQEDRRRTGLVQDLGKKARDVECALPPGEIEETFPEAEVDVYERVRTLLRQFAKHTRLAAFRQGNEDDKAVIAAARFGDRRVKCLDIARVRSRTHFGSVIRRFRVH